MQNDRCIMIDWPMAKAFVTVRSTTYVLFFVNIMLRVCFILLPFCFWAREYVGFWFFFFFHILSQFLLPPQSTVFGAGQLVNDPKEIAYRYFQGEFFLDLFLVIPLPQVLLRLVGICSFAHGFLILFFFVWLQIWICRIMPKNLDAFGNNYANILLHIAVFFQYIPKLGRLLPVLARLKPWLFLVQLTFLINLLTFMLAGHVVGISWYFLGLQVWQNSQNLYFNLNISNILSLS